MCVFQINILLRDMKQESQFDKVFSKCLQSFHRELKSTLSVHLQVTTFILELFQNFKHFSVSVFEQNGGYQCWNS